jgi:hypothetical protein
MMHQRLQKETNYMNTNNDNPLHQTSRTHTTIEEKKSRLLWEEYTRDAPIEVKKTASTRPCVGSEYRYANDNDERHLIVHTTQGQAPQGCQTLKAASPDLSLLYHALGSQPNHHLSGSPPSSQDAMLHKPTTHSQTT